MTNTVELTADGTVRSAEGGPIVDPMLGRLLLHYRVEQRIGQGGMSVVYRGRDERLGREVAIKVLHPFLAEKAECRARLAREARAVARLEHENILRIFDFSGDPITLDERPATGDERGEGGPRPAQERTLPRGHSSEEGFLVTELVPGSTLKRYADDHRMWDLPEAGALVVWQLARALQHAHDQGVVHRDIKPENVMVRDDGVLKLMDFGIAQVADSKSLTVTGTLLGSPAHMAPECIEGMHADARSDLFSLGTVLYWLMCGALPFEALSPHALLKAIVDGRYPPPQQKQPRVSDELARVIKRAMAIRPDDRYQTAGQLADALAAALITAGLDPSARAVAESLADPSSSFPRLAARVREAALARARALLDEGAPTRALQALGRVIAEHPQDPAARALLDQAQSAGWDDDNGDDGAGEEGATEADRSLPPKEVDDDPVTAVTAELGAYPSAAGTPVPGSLAARGQGSGLFVLDGEKPSLRLTLQRVALVVTAGGLIAVAAAVATNLDRLSLSDEGAPSAGEGADGRGPPADPSRGPEIEGMSMMPNGRPPPATVRPAEGHPPPHGGQARRPGDSADLGRDGDKDGRRPDLANSGAAADPARLAGRPPPSRIATLAVRAPGGPRPDPGAPTGGAAATATAAAPGTQGDAPDELIVHDSPTANAAPPRLVLIKVNSYGTLRVDGREVVQLSPLKVNEVSLPPGEHRLLFAALAALPVERALVVPAEGEPPRVEVQFEPKPAELVVKSDTPLAYIAVRALLGDSSGQETIVGQAADSERRPFLLRFPPHPSGRMVGKLTFEVVATHQDRIVTRRVDLRAGQVKTLRIDLRPGASASADEQPDAP